MIDLLQPINNIYIWQKQFPLSINLLIVLWSSWRITHLLITESGPFNISTHLRRLFGIKELNDGTLTVYPDNFWGGLFGCFWCMNFWVVIFCICIILVFPFILLPFAISGLAIYLETFRR